MMTEHSDMIEKRKMQIALDKWGERIEMIEVNCFQGFTTITDNSGKKKITDHGTWKVKIKYPEDYLHEDAYFERLKKKMGYE